MANQFTNPIRYFKANDPYYYEVDNIPLKQLQENCLYLREQLTEGSDSDISRNEFIELKPYAYGSSNVSVKPGRFTGRVNEAYNKGNIINLILDKPAGADPAAYTDASSISFPSYKGEAGNENYAEITDNDILEIIYSKTAAYSYPGLNGLLENIQHFFSTFNWLKNAWNTAPYSTSGFTMYDNSHTSYGAGTGTIQYGAAIAANDPLLDDDATGEDRFGGANGDVVDGMGAYSSGFKEYFPGTDDIRPGRHFRTQEDPANNYALGNHISHYQTLATLFTIKWKGVFRTSIVDVKADLSITVPGWDENDFGGTVANGGANPTHRIDLLFIYTHPVDSDETYISRYKGNTTPERITTPQLGIVKGAAVVKDKDEVNASFTDAAGNRTILGNQADTINGNLGFENATGSFPSPDDLMNLAPLIAADIEDDNLCLVGQSILPVAYIRVNNPGESGPVTINSNDIIDIRPFFRTAELAYNERAGIAAANPPLSIANPAIGKTELWNATDSILSTPLNEFAFPESGLNMNENIIMNMADPTALKSAATKGYVDAADDDLQTTLDGVNSRTLGQTSWSNYEILPVSMNFERIVNLGAPEAINDAATQQYVDESIQNPMVQIQYTSGTGVHYIDALQSNNEASDLYGGADYYGMFYDAAKVVPTSIKIFNLTDQAFDLPAAKSADDMITWNADNTGIKFVGEGKTAIWKVTLVGRIGINKADADNIYFGWAFGIPVTDSNTQMRRLHYPIGMSHIDDTEGDGLNMANIGFTGFIQFGGAYGEDIGGNPWLTNVEHEFCLYLAAEASVDDFRLYACTLTMERVSYASAGTIEPSPNEL